MDRRLIHLILGARLNMITVVLNRAHNHIVFLAAERAEEGRYLEMVRLEPHLSPLFQEELCRMIQVGDEAGAFDALEHELVAVGLARFVPGLLKISDLFFFESFHQLYACRKTPLRYLRTAAEVAHRVISRRLLYFYPQIPAQRMLSFLRLLCKPPALESPSQVEGDSVWS